jgi:hypothetical protein
MKAAGVFQRLVAQKDVAVTAVKRADLGAGHGGFVHSRTVSTLHQPLA